MSDRPGGQPRPRDPMTAAADDARQVAGQAKEAAGQVAETVKDKATSLAGEARAHGEELLDTARERAEGFAEEGKAMGAEKASALADAIRNAARDLEGTSPEIAQHVRGAADSVQGIAAALRDRSAGQLFEDVTDFARRQPTAFFGVAALAGFALARFMKSSAATHTRSMSGGTQGLSGGQHAPGWVQASPGRSAHPATMAAASLGGAAAHRSGEARPGSMPVSPATPATPAAPPSGGPHMSGNVPNEHTGSAL